MFPQRDNLAGPRWCYGSESQVLVATIHKKVKKNNHSETGSNFCKQFMIPFSVSEMDKIAWTKKSLWTVGAQIVAVAETIHGNDNQLSKPATYDCSCIYEPEAFHENGTSVQFRASK